MDVGSITNFNKVFVNLKMSNDFQKTVEQLLYFERLLFPHLTFETNEALATTAFISRISNISSSWNSCCNNSWEKFNNRSVNSPQFRFHSFPNCPSPRICLKIFLILYFFRRNENFLGVVKNKITKIHKLTSCGWRQSIWWWQQHEWGRPTQT